MLVPRTPLAFVLKHRREELKITQSQMSRLTGIPRSHINHLESGRRTIGKQTFDSVCTGYKISPELLLFLDWTIPCWTRPKEDKVFTGELGQLELISRQATALSSTDLFRITQITKFSIKPMTESLVLKFLHMSAELTHPNSS